MGKFEIGERVAFKVSNCAYTGKVIGKKKRIFTTLYMIEKEKFNGVECVAEKNVFKI